MGTVTITNKKVAKFLNKTMVMGKLTMSNAYAADGDTIPLAFLGLEKLEQFQIVQKGKYILEPVLGTTSKLKVKDPNKMTQREVIQQETGAAVVLSLRARIAGDLTYASLICEVCGDSGNTVFDIGNGGTSAFTTAPTVANDATDGIDSEDNGTIDAANDDFAIGDEIRLTLAIANAVTGITFAFEITGTGEVPATTDLSSVLASVDFFAIGTGLVAED